VTAPRRVLVTGAAGNLGGKLIAALHDVPWCEEVVAVDRTADGVSPFARWIADDLRHANPAWTEAFATLERWCILPPRTRIRMQAGPTARRAST
jgi:nucleoside-diphosphate-sugar epimerase